MHTLQRVICSYSADTNEVSCVLISYNSALGREKFRGVNIEGFHYYRILELQILERNCSRVSVPGSNKAHYLLIQNRSSMEHQLLSPSF